MVSHVMMKWGKGVFRLITMYCQHRSMTSIKTKILSSFPLRLFWLLLALSLSLSFKLRWLVRKFQSLLIISDAILFFF